MRPDALAVRAGSRGAHDPGRSLV